MAASVVVPTDTRAYARDVSPVDVNRDRRGFGRVVDAVDIAGRRESVDIADMVVAAADHVEVGVEQILVLDALDDAEHAPGHVVVDARHLPGPPDQGDDRERTVGLDVQSVAAIAVWRSQ